MVECLLKNGADITSRNKNRKTPLHFATVQGNKEALQVLLRYGADPRERDYRGQTPRDALLDYERPQGFRIERIE